MDIILACPSGLATGGTEGIHNLCHYLNLVGANAKILYIGSKHSPQPEQYRNYECDYVTDFPKDFKGVVILPEVWGNEVTSPKYKDCQVAINWQGVDVYSWHVPERDRGKYLQRQNTIHIANSEYAMRFLTKQGLQPVKIADCLNDAFFDIPLDMDNRGNVVLYNPTGAKLTRFQETVMSRCTTELGIRFRPIERLTRDGVIDLFKHSKLYIDFGVFSGRERLPREAVMCGCCILTSDKGTAHYFNDNSIMDMYKVEDVTTAMQRIKYVLDNYRRCVPDFNMYRELLTKDKQNYIEDVRKLYEVFNNHTSA